MARDLRIPVIVEGVEDKKQIRQLVDMGCTYVQGYYYYRPMSQGDFENLLAKSA